MKRSLRQWGVRAVCLVAVPGILMVSSGCGNSADKEPGAKGIPPSVEESNKSMQDFMNANKANKKGAKH